MKFGSIFAFKNYPITKKCKCRGRRLCLPKSNKKYAISGKYDGKNVYLFKNNNKSSSDLIEGKIKSPGRKMIMALGENPDGENTGSNFFNGTIYSVRIYNRALTDDEVMQNYKIDKMLYGVEDINE